MVDDARAGLCASCGHVRLVSTSRGGVFYLCVEAVRDPSLRKYPVIPVRTCHAYQALSCGARAVASVDDAKRAG